MTGTPDRHPGPAPGAAAAIVVGAGALVFAASLGWFVVSYLVRFDRVPPPGDAAPPAALDALLFSAFALHHSLFARTGIKRRVQARVPPHLERSLYTWIASLLFLATCTWWQPVPGVLYRLDAPWAWIGYAAQIAGFVLTFFGARALDALDLAGVRPFLLRTAGRTTAHVPLTTTGVFAVVRHPLYFGWALFVWGAPHMTATRAVFALVSTAYVAIAIPWEERALIGTFGADYEAYKKRVRWRMMPWLY